MYAYQSGISKIQCREIFHLFPRLNDKHTVDVVTSFPISFFLLLLGFLGQWGLSTRNKLLSRHIILLARFFEALFIWSWVPKRTLLPGQLY